MKNQTYPMHIHRKGFRLLIIVAGSFTVLLVILFACLRFLPFEQREKTDITDVSTVFDAPSRILAVPLDSTINWKTYNHDEIFSIVYPSTWSTSDTDQHFQQGNVFQATISEECKEQYCSGASVVVNEVARSVTSKQYLEKKLKDRAYEIESIYPVIINGHPYIHYISCTLGCYDTYLFEKHGVVYEVSVYADEQYKNITDQIVSSIGL